MNNADEIRKKIQAAKDALFSEIMIRADRRVFTPLINKLVDDVRSLEVRLIEAERVILKPVPSYDSLAHGQKYFVSCCKGGERDFVGTTIMKAIVINNAEQIFIPVE